MKLLLLCEQHHAFSFSVGEVKSRKKAFVQQNAMGCDSFANSDAPSFRGFLSVCRPFLSKEIDRASDSVFKMCQEKANHNFAFFSQHLCGLLVDRIAVLDALIYFQPHKENSSKQKNANNITIH